VRNGADGWLAEARRVSLFRDRDEGLAINYHNATNLLANCNPSPIPTHGYNWHRMLVVLFPSYMMTSILQLVERLVVPQKSVQKKRTLHQTVRLDEQVSYSRARLLVKFLISNT
jgi:hypothetical protein